MLNASVLLSERGALLANVEPPLLSARGIVKRFNALVVLDGVDFKLGRGEAVGIVGPNGAGKTTLLNVLAGAFAPSAGQVWFGDDEITTLGAARRCKLGIARSHQVPRPFGGMTVFENVLVAAQAGGGFRGEEAYDRVTDSLAQCGMLRVANRKAATIGLLDRKRLELARVLATDPVVLLLDEIGGGLTDAEAALLVETILDLRRRNIAIVWIEHIVHSLLQVIDRLVCMDAGKVIADGDPKDVISNAAVVDAYFGGAAA